MASFPTLGAEHAPFMLNTRRLTKWSTVVNHFANDTEQRWPGRGSKLYEWEMVFEIPPRLVGPVRQFFIDEKGKLGKTWDITVGGTLYENMTFLQDDFSVTEEVGLARFTLRASQVLA